MRNALLAGFIAVSLAGCAGLGERLGLVEVIPADVAPIALLEGEPAPQDGWFLTPATLQKLVPCLQAQFEEGSGAGDQGSAGKH